MTRPPRLLSALAIAVFMIACVMPAGALLVNLVRHAGDEPTARATEAALSAEAHATLMRTLRVAGMTTAACLALGLPFAVLLARTRVPGRAAWRFVTFLGLLLPGYFATMGWTSLLGFEGSLTKALGLGDGNWAPLYTEFGQALVMVGGLFPIVPLLTAPALRRVRPELEDAARLETGLSGAIRRVTLPAAAPEIAAAGLLVFALAAGGFSSTDLLPTKRLYASWVFSGYLEHRFDSAAVTARMLPLPLLLLPAAVAVAWMFARREAGEGHLAGGTAPDFPLSPAARLSALGFVAAVWMLTVGVPLIAVAIKLVPAGGRLADAWDVYCGAWRHAAPGLADSLWAATPAAILGAAAAMLLAGRLADSPRGRRWGWLTLLPAIIPAGLVGTGMIVLRHDLPCLAPLLGHDLTVTGLDGQRWTIHTAGLVLTLTDLARFLPFALAVAIAGFRRLDRTRLEAAAVDGATRGQTWRLVICPVVLPYAAAGALLMLALSLGEIETALQVMPPNRTPLAAVIYEQAHRNLEHDLAGLCMVLFTILTAAAAAAWALLGRRE